MKRGTKVHLLFWAILSILTLCAFGFSKSRAAIAVRVVVENRKGDNLSGASVTISGPIGSQGPIGALAPWKGTTNGRGEAEFNLSVPGDYDLTITHKDHRTATARMKVPSGQSSFTMKMILSDKTVYGVDIQVVDKKGKGVKNGWVTVTPVADKDGIGAITQTTDEEGNVSFNLGSAEDFTVTAGGNFYTSTTGTIFVSSSLTRLKHKIVLDSKNSRISVTVLSADRQEPIIGANVSIQSEDGIVKDSLATDLTGVAHIIMPERSDSTKGRTFQITATDEGYETGHGTVTTEKGVYKDFPTTIFLKRKDDRKVVVVQVLDENDQPLPMANVSLASGRNYYSGSTGADGNAVFSAKEGRYEVLVTRTGYESGTAVVSVQIKAAQKAYQVEVPLDKKENQKNFRRGIRVRVKGKDKDGKIVNLPNAQIQLSNGQGGVTDANGKFEFYHRVTSGEILSATARATGYKEGSNSTTVGASGTLVDTSKFPLDLSKYTAIDNITVTLEREIVKGEITGDLVLSSGSIKVGENITAMVNMLYSGKGENRIQADLSVEVFGPPSGGRVKSQAATRTLTKDRYDKTPYVFKFTQWGSYTVKVKATAPNGVTWSDTAKFIVVNKQTEPEKPVKDANFDGTWWTSEASHMVLKQSGNGVTGTYNYAGGTITGTVKGRTLTFKWKQTNEREGVGKFHMNDTNTAFTGEWDYTVPADHVGKGRGWSGSKKKE